MAYRKSDTKTHNINTCYTHWIGGNRKRSSTYSSVILFGTGTGGSKIARNGVFDCHLALVGRQMAIENIVPNYFWSTFIDTCSINVFDCRLSGV